MNESMIGNPNEAPTGEQLDVALEVLRVHDVFAIGGFDLGELARIVVGRDCRDGEVRSGSAVTCGALAAAVLSLRAALVVAGENSQAQSRLYVVKSAEAETNLREIQRLDFALAKARAELEELRQANEALRASHHALSREATR